jgi:Ca2+-binding EF-hand superfamily protein
LTAPEPGKPRLGKKTHTQKKTHQLKKMTTRNSTSALTDELRSEIEDVFRMFDDDDSGAIDARELISALFTITGEKIPREEALAIVAKYDRDHNGTIDRAEFEAMVMERLHGRSQEEETSRAFKLLEDSVNAPGHITKDSVRRAAAECGEVLTEEDLNDMFSIAVIGQTTPKVNFSTFCSIQLKQLQQQQQQADSAVGSPR